MSDFTGSFAAQIEEMLSLRVSMGRSPRTHRGNLLSFDRFCTRHFPCAAELSQEMVLQWMEKRPGEKTGGSQARASAIRCFGSCLDAAGIPAYILPDKFVGGNSDFTPYIFNDTELAAVFSVIDSLSSTSRHPFLHLILPVFFRLIYTCGLRPREGRELLHKNIHFETGEILIVQTKGHKDRMVVMSDDMLELCRVYEQKRRIFAPGSTHFFPDADGGALPGSRLNKQFQKCWLAANPGQDADTLPGVRIYDLRNTHINKIPAFS
jgi:integrase